MKAAIGNEDLLLNVKTLSKGELEAKLNNPAYTPYAKFLFLNELEIRKAKSKLKSDYLKRLKEKQTAAVVS